RVPAWIGAGQKVTDRPQPHRLEKADRADDAGTDQHHDHYLPTLGNGCRYVRVDPENEDEAQGPHERYEVLDPQTEPPSGVNQQRRHDRGQDQDPDGHDDPAWEAWPGLRVEVVRDGMDRSQEKREVEGREQRHQRSARYRSAEAGRKRQHPEPERGPERGCPQPDPEDAQQGDRHERRHSLSRYGRDGQSKRDSRAAGDGASGHQADAHVAPCEWKTTLSSSAYNTTDESWWCASTCSYLALSSGRISSAGTLAGTL